MHKTIEPDIGYIYCLSNDSYKDTYKIGFTKNDPIARMIQLNTTGLLTPFKLEFAKQVINHQEKEKKLHLIFDKYRVNKNREFFKVDLKEIKQLFDLIDGEWYKIKQQTPISELPMSNPIKPKTSINISKQIQSIPIITTKSSQFITNCSRCFDKFEQSDFIIKCKHNDICKQCIVNLDKCPICKQLYKKLN
jgi:hypothetical protein